MFFLAMWYSEYVKLSQYSSFKFFDWDHNIEQNYYTQVYIKKKDLKIITPGITIK